MIFGCGTNWNSGVESGYIIGADDGTGASIFSRQHAVDDNQYLSLNSQIQGVDWIGIGNGKVHTIMTRKASTDFDVWNNGAKQNIGRASFGIPNCRIFYGLQSYNNVPYVLNASATNIRYAFLFKGLSEAEGLAVMNIMETYLDKYGKGLI